MVEAKMMAIPVLTCKRCGWDWVPRTTKSPVECPRCKSRFWKEKAKPK